MHILSVLSFVFAFGVFFIGIFFSTDNPIQYIDFVSIFIVFGGTLAAASISFKMEKLVNLAKVAIRRVLKGDTIDYSGTIAELMTLANAYRTQPEKVKELVENSNDFFIKETMNLMLDETLNQKDFVQVMRARVLKKFESYDNDAEKFKTMCKYPPAFGMMGTTIGMIALLGKLGTEDAVNSLGPAMAICMITTLYGVALANLIFLPIAENLTASARETKLKDEMIAEGVRLIQQKTNPIVLAEKLNSFLQPGQRINWRDFQSTSGAAV